MTEKTIMVHDRIHLQGFLNAAVHSNVFLQHTLRRESKIAKFYFVKFSNFFTLKSKTPMLI